MQENIKNIGNRILPNESFLHPNTLDINKNLENKDIIPTKFYFSNNILEKIKMSYGKKINDNELKKYMLYPSTVINYTEILKIYNIITYDDLFLKIKELINDGKLFKTIDRIINCWIKSNFDDLKNKNNILINIYIYVFNKYNNKININESKLKSEIKNWFNNQKNNLGEEIIKNLNLDI